MRLLRHDWPQQRSQFFRLQRRLVSVGRYSARYLDALGSKWDEGWLGYEEISLPMLCVQPAC